MVDLAPQLRLLQSACLTITHAGLNTVLECLACGVPMLCLPVTNDQPGVAQRVKWLGLGKALPANRVNPQRLRQQLQALMADDEIRQNVFSRQRELSQLDGCSLAADIIEKALGQPPRTMASTSDTIQRID